MEGIDTNNKQLYKCDICGKVGNWTDGWQWFGSYKDWEDGEILLYTCSSKCRNNITELDAINLLKKLREQANRFDLQVNF